MARRRLLALAVILLFSAAPARAQLLYDNGAPNWTDQASGWEYSGYLNAADFAVADNATLSSVRFWAAEYSPNAFSNQVFWSIMSNGGSVPGASLASGLATPTPTFIRGGQNADGRVWSGYQFDFALPDLMLGPGIYWLALHDGPLADNTRREVYWQTTDRNSSATDVIRKLPSGTWYVDQAGHDLAFQIYDSPTQATPEPVTMVLLGSGLVGIAGAVKRRRSRRSEA